MRQWCVICNQSRTILVVECARAAGLQAGTAGACNLHGICRNRKARQANAGKARNSAGTRRLDVICPHAVAVTCRASAGAPACILRRLPPAAGRRHGLQQHGRRPQSKCGRRGLQRLGRRSRVKRRCRPNLVSIFYFVFVVSTSSYTSISLTHLFIEDTILHRFSMW
jgi:hypothetical protein